MHTSRSLITKAKNVGIPILSGVSSFDDMNSAISFGCNALKVYPSRLIKPNRLHQYIKKLAIDRTIPIFVSGSVSTADFEPYLLAGATGFMIGFDLNSLPVEVIISELKRLNGCLKDAKRNVKAKKLAQSEFFEDELFPS